MRGSRLIALVACLFVAGSGAALVNAAPPKQAPITVAITGLNCSTALGGGTFEARSWSWGAKVETIGGSSGGSGAGKAQLNALELTRVSDACSPALLSGLAKRGTFWQAHLVSGRQRRAVLKATVILESLTISEWHVGGTDTSEPTEELAVSFAKFTLLDIASSNKFCWDVPENKGC